MRRWVLALVSAGFCALALHAHAAPRIAIIIDDLGYSRAHGDAIVALPAPVTCAVIPFSPHAHRLAERAAQTGKEVIVHMPMAAQQETRLDQGGLHLTMSEPELTASVRSAIAYLPQARGLNNHMGSALTEQRAAMDWLMRELKQQQLFFVDSRTSGQSVAQHAAHQAGIAHAGRDIFLDNERDLAAINAQFNKLIALARKRGHAIGIGHPYPETVSYLQQVIPLLELAGIEVVPVSDLLKKPALTATTEEKEKTQEDS